MNLEQGPRGARITVEPTKAIICDCGRKFAETGSVVRVQHPGRPAMYLCVYCRADLRAALEGS